MMSMGLLMPAEWESHRATWLTWPHDERHWPGNFEPIPAVFAEMARQLARGEEVHILVNSSSDEQLARTKIGTTANSGRIYFHGVRSNFAWIRDHGPIFVRTANGESRILHFRYNAWGGKWEHDHDCRIPSRIAELAMTPKIEVPFVLEGGSIDVDGNGSLLTTTDCLLNPNRNPGLNHDDIERNLREYFGVSDIIWLRGVLAGDDTDGHVDQVARFASRSTVLAAYANPDDDSHFPYMQENLRKLRNVRMVDGRSLEVIPLPLPAPVYREGIRLPASYLNFYVCNAVVLMPAFNDRLDDQARDLLHVAFPDREVVSIDCRDLIWGLGAFHCLTQQEPSQLSLPQ